MTTNHSGSTIDTTTFSTSASEISSRTGGTQQVTCLADYQVQGLIGRGKYSQVFAAIHTATGCPVALKKVAIFDMMEPQARSDCLKEVKILQNLEHPNIVKCFNSFIQDNDLIIVMEWAQSGDLQHLLRERVVTGVPFPYDQVWIMFSQICHALHHMHTRRMMHRDLKPGNIFVAQDGALKLGDLGLSRYFSSRTLQAMTTVGTPYYMSPECIKGQPYDFSSDIWSLGCMLYELIALRNPFFKENQSIYMLGKNISSCTYASLPETVPQALREVVVACLQPSPQQRPTITQLCQVCTQNTPFQ
eukprot:CAMPEP_0119109734 /NCGR_PEP_ID=MMETSP1180-20130426/22781_1 /TAXON_ID=3052 ORGANISM="Chlamydomonas cf sp, Strain CCMP681" /NCGR_SAMPLE_ID=MMETSP1180 /ASSEMBLY_ACC=CAM_ASM_000741 /LENGTH=302 /DNA_ID=CAMNT_0007095665 /DNA_START=161 /DNA_END=1069 /DNA_ORIENTATION=+